MLRSLGLDFVGIVLLALTAFELYATILRARKRPGPLSTRLNRWIWALVSAASHSWQRSSRHAALAVIGPLLLPMLGALMVVCLLLGFGCLDLAHFPAGFTASVAGKPNWQNAFYFSGVTLLTIGYGDIMPHSSGMRVLALLEGTAGIAVLSLATAYLLTVYGAVEQKRAKALTLHHEGGRDSSPTGLIAHTFRRGHFRGLEEILRSGSRDLQIVMESHIEHPVIYYFHTEAVAKSFPGMIFLLLESATLISSCLNPKAYEDLVDSPDMGALQEGSHAVVDEIMAGLQLQAEAAHPFDGPPGAYERRRRAWEHARSTFGRRGIALREDEEDSLRLYLDDRGSWEQKLYVISRFLGYDWEEISGDPGH